MDIQSHAADDIDAFLSFNSCHHNTWYPCTGIQTTQACAQVQVVENWNNPCYPGGNIANASSMALTSSLLCLHRFHRLGGFCCCFLCSLLCHAGERWKTGKGTLGMLESLKTSFLEPDQRASCALLGTGCNVKHESLNNSICNILWMQRHHDHELRLHCMAPLGRWKWGLSNFVII